jgi:hypothetical protein
MNPQNNMDLLYAFPSNRRDDALAVISVLPENLHGKRNFTVRVSNEQLLIPQRLYHDPKLIQVRKLSDTQRHLVDCLLTRHKDGHVRQEHLVKILGVDNPWVPAYVIQLLGEYVIEIQKLIETRLLDLDKSLYSQFLLANPEFLALTEQRVVSYWDCYYRNQKKEDYAGFRVLRFFTELAAEKGY